MAYQDVEDKLYHGHRKVANNTYLELVKGPRIDMRLHGHIVAEFYRDHIELYSAGYHTNTTKDRLNLALSLAGIKASIWQEDWKWYYGSYNYLKMPFKSGMKITYNGANILVEA